MILGRECERIGAQQSVDGTVEKALFTITCTTCQARLAVRSEAAIGTILECPKCESMVHITPPEGWRPAQSPGQEGAAADPSAPPPLDRVADSPITLELDTTASLFGNIWIICCLALLISAAVIWGLWAMLSPGPVAGPTAETLIAANIEQNNTGNNAKQSEAAQAPAVHSDKQPSQPPVDNPPDEPPPVEPTPSSPETPTTQSSPSVTEQMVKPTPVVTEPPLFPSETENEEDEKSPPIEYKRLPPTPVDVAARLADPLAGIEFNDVSLIKAIGLLSSMSGVPVTIDADALARLGVSPRERITLRLDSTTFGGALRAVAEKRGLGLVTDGEGATVTTPEDQRESTRKIRYTVSDLTGNDPKSMADLADLIQNLIEPLSWRDNGGEGTIAPDGDALSIVQTGNIHWQVLVFCEKLRTARHLPLRSRVDADLFALKTRADRARKMFDRPVTANFRVPATLDRILSYLSEQSGTSIVVDRAALTRADTSSQVEATLTASNRKLSEALAELLDPLELTYRVVGESLIQVTMKEAAAERLELEFYPIDVWLRRGVAIERLAEQLKARVAPVSWNDVGGEAEIYFDAPSECFIILQSQPAQAKIQQLLASPPK